MRLRKSKKAAAETRAPAYHEQIEARMSEHGGKMFLVDASKKRVLGALQTLFAKAPDSSFLCIVQDPKTAYEYRQLLDSGREITLVTSVEDLLSLLEPLGASVKRLSDEALIKTAPLFLKQYPRLIVCFHQDEASVLHHELCKTEGKNGQYADVQSVPYCISDFLAACRYRFAVVDGVYQMLSFEAEDTEHMRDDPRPDRDEQIFLNGVRYFTDLHHSYHKLHRVVDGAEKCILLSDTVAEEEVLPLYAALHMIDDCFSYRKAADLAKAHEQNFVMECENFYSTAMGCCNNDTIMSFCLQHLRENRQWFPKYIRSLGEHIKQNLDFMSQEETFFRFLYAIADRQFHLNYQSNAQLLYTLGDPELIAQAYCDVFFSDALKGEFESNLTQRYLCCMEKDELDRMMTLFREHGGYIEESQVSYEGSVVRIYHDESAFEELIRSHELAFDKQDNAFSVSNLGDDAIYKCAVVKQMIDNGTWETPVLVVSRDSGETVAERFADKLNVMDCGFDLTDHPFFERKHILAVDYERLRNTAASVPIRTAVFFDVLPDVNDREILMRKAALLADAPIKIKFVVSYSDLNGHMAEAWGSTLLQPSPDYLPVRRAALFTRAQKVEAFSDIMGDIDTLYRDMKHLVEGHHHGKVEPIADRYSETVAKYTDFTRISIERVAEDFEYFAGISEMYRAIFENSTTVGAQGRDVFSKTTPVIPKRKQKIVQKKGKTVYPEIFETNHEPALVMFNVCAQQLHCTCDVTLSNCGSCLKYESLMTNKFSVFSDQVVKFFDKTVELMEKAEKAEKKSIGGRMIQSEGNKMVMNNTHRLGDVISHRDRALADLRVLTESVPVIAEYEGSSQHFFCAPFETVKSIRDHVSAVYTDMFKKYYLQFTNVFREINLQMKKALEIAGPNDASASSANTK